MRAAGADGIHVIANGVIFRSEKTEEEEDKNADQNDSKREEDELKQDRAGRFTREIDRSRQGLARFLRRVVDHRPVWASTKSGKYPLSWVGASGTTMASLSQTDSQRRQAT